MQNSINRVDNISSLLKQRSEIIEKQKVILEGYVKTLNDALTEWDSSRESERARSDASLDKITSLRRKFSIVKLLMQRLVTDQAGLNADIDLFERFVEEKTLFVILEWVSLLRMVDNDMQELIDPTIYGLSDSVPRSFSNLLKWTPDSNSNKLDHLLYKYLQNLC